MSNKIKDTQYLYLSALLRSREAKMLTRDRAERMLEAQSFEEAAKLLEDCGYADMSKMSAKQVEDALAEHRTQIFGELAALAPDASLVDAFRLKYDYHNAKVLIKAEGVRADGERLLSGAGRIAVRRLEDAFNNEDYFSLPAAFAAALEASRGILARTDNPQLADFVLDSAYFAELLSIAQQANSPFLTSYARLLIDASNLSSIVRTLRMGRGEDFLKTALVAGGNIDTARLVASATGEGLTALFVASPLQDAAALGAAAILGESLTAFELACDNSLTSHLNSAKLVSFGESPVVAYLAALESEITSARMILTGRLSGISADVIRERLRDSYA